MLNPLQPLLKEIAQCDYNRRLALVPEISEFITSEDLNYADYRLIWKALFYALWDQDKDIQQNNLSEQFAKMIYQFEQFPSEWIKAGFSILNQEWTKLDYFRVNKFMFLVRRMVVELINYLAGKKFTKKLVKKYCLILKDVIFNENADIGLVLHIIQIYNQVIFKIDIPSEQAFEYLLEPFIQYLRIGTKKLFRDIIIKNIFRDLIEKYNNEEIPKFINLQNLRTLLFKFAAEKTIKQENRKMLYQLCEELNLDNTTLALPKENLTWTTKQNLKKFNQCGTRLKRLSKLDYLVKKQQQQQFKQFEDDDEDDEDNNLNFDGIDDYEDDDYDDTLDEEDEQRLNMKMMGMNDDFDDDLYAQYYLQQSDEGFDYFPQGLSPKQLKELYPGLPIYYYYSAKQRKKYFEKLNQKYKNNLSQETNVSKPKHSKQVKFNLKVTKTKLFSQKDKIMNSQKPALTNENKVKSPGKSVLKPIDYEIQISNPLKTKRKKMVSF